MKLPTPPVPDAATEWALFLDVDGTLIEFAPTPDAVQVPPGLISLLLRLQHRLHGALALISGRRIASLDNLFKPLLLPAAGLHGFECRDARGLLRTTNVDAAHAQMLRRHAHEVAHAFPDLLLEDKEFSVAFHYRAMEMQRAQLHATLRQLAADLDVELLEGHKVFELKPAQVNKGRALAQFMVEAPFAGRVPVFLGDDHTDEFALAQARELGGLAIQIDERIASRAQFELPDPPAVWRWLQQWETQLSEVA